MGRGVGGGEIWAVETSLLLLLLRRKECPQKSTVTDSENRPGLKEKERARRKEEGGEHRGNETRRKSPNKKTYTGTARNLLERSSRLTREN